ncbi:trypsin, alkaline B-like [Bicyclus anynana]|uniref:Trypsin, alkaline B-like n=1 Tax=Bicyclus anynana TaxID=110368 RepID=A0ABM3LXZ8_BICAN|nr:trypsin, alkaline B-like [Bicyclus anynana]
MDQKLYILYFTALPKQERIVGGTVTSINQYPYSVAVLYVRSNGPFVQGCGGTIINNRSVLSVAHCIGACITCIRLRVGSTYASSGGVVHHVAQIIRHPQFNSATMANDIGLVRVLFPFQFGPTVQPAAIAGPNAVIPYNTVVTAIGWGWKDHAGVNPSEELRHVQIPTVPHATCQNSYTFMTLTAGHMCAGPMEGGRGSCQGDSGSPLIYNNVVIACTSFGNGCARPNYPALYSRVAYFSNWIVDHA